MILLLPGVRGVAPGGWRVGVVTSGGAVTAVTAVPGAMMVEVAEAKAKAAVAATAMAMAMAVTVMAPKVVEGL